MQFPDGPFEIEMIRGVFGFGRRIEKGETLRVPGDIQRSTAIRWCTRRRPFAQLVEPAPENPAPLQNATRVDEPKEPPELAEGQISVATHDDPGASAPGWESLSYSELQRHAKERGIKANQSRSALIEALS